MATRNNYSRSVNWNLPSNEHPYNNFFMCATFMCDFRYRDVSFIFTLAGITVNVSFKYSPLEDTHFRIIYKYEKKSKITLT